MFTLESYVVTHCSCRSLSELGKGGSQLWKPPKRMNRVTPNSLGVSISSISISPVNFLQWARTAFVNTNRKISLKKKLMAQKQTCRSTMFLSLNNNSTVLVQIQLAGNYWLIAAFVRRVLVADKVFSTVNKPLVGSALQQVLPTYGLEWSIHAKPHSPISEVYKELLTQYGQLGQIKDLQMF